MQRGYGTCSQYCTSSASTRQVQCEIDGPGLSPARPRKESSMFTPSGSSSQSNDIQDNTICLSGSHSSHDPYCSDPDCWCHKSDSWHEHAVGIPQHDEETIRSAFSLFGIRQ